MCPLESFVFINKGFRKCNKLGITSSPADLTDSYLQIFKHAQQQNFGNILILEDDFVFSENQSQVRFLPMTWNFLLPKRF